MNICVRRANTCDCQFFFDLRTFPEYQQFFYSKQRITLEQHRKWFEARIRSTRHIYMIAELDGDTIGFVRFEPLSYPDCFEIGFALHPDFLGRGLSYHMLTNSISLLNLEVGGIKPLVFASVLQSNSASMASLQKVGFSRASHEEISSFAAHFNNLRASSLLSFRY